MQRREKYVPSDEPSLVKRMIELACQYGRYGYPRVTVFLREEGFRTNHKRIGRLWRREGLKVPKRQPKRRRLWLNDGSCIRLRPAHRDHVWSYDFVQDRTSEGRPIRMLTIIDEYTRECPASVCGRPGDSGNRFRALSSYQPTAMGGASSNVSRMSRSPGIARTRNVGANIRVPSGESKCTREPEDTTE